MLVTIITGTSQAAADGDVGSEECRVVQLNAQNFVESALGNRKAKQSIGIFKAHMAVHAAKMAGEITRQCAWCIRKQLIGNIGIGYQVPCGTDPPVECGNYDLERGEECDDGNIIDGDGCSAECLEEKICAKCYAGELDADCDGWCTPVDCDDTDPEVHPNSGWHTEERATGGYDWNCSGYTEKQVYRYPLELTALPRELCNGLLLVDFGSEPPVERCGPKVMTQVWFVVGKWVGGDKGCSFVDTGEVGHFDRSPYPGGVPNACR